jgi:ABC-type antimicrobial peptide transport system permease subunit
MSISAEGLSINLVADPKVLLIGLGISMGVGVAAGLFPAWRAARHEIAQCFRAV